LRWRVVVTTGHTHKKHPPPIQTLFRADFFLDLFLVHFLHASVFLLIRHSVFVPTSSDWREFHKQS
jgi:hypothetical protein